MRTELLLGDEAVAWGAIDAGIAGAFSYPGTPSTEIFEAIEDAVRRGAEVSALWSTNEKVAYEEALGMSYAGRRALVSMKHVRLNVAADPFVNSALTGVCGGLVLAVADDPGMHSSQNEQDTRWYAELAQVPLFEPWDQQSAYDLTREAFAYSEAIGLPVIIRLVTRLVNPRNPLDLTPMATEAAYAAAIELMLACDEVDALLLGVVPLTAALRTMGSDLEHERSLVKVLPELLHASPKPSAVVIDSGARYEPLVHALRKQGLCVLRSADQAVRSFGRWLCHPR